MTNRDLARVDTLKLERYLLSDTHPVGRSKAKYFKGIGFEAGDSARLARCLLEIAQEGKVVDMVRNAHGTKYVIDGWISVIKEADVLLRTIWIVETGKNEPRFVTAYPTVRRK